MGAGDLAILEVLLKLVAFVLCALFGVANGIPHHGENAEGKDRPTGLRLVAQSTGSHADNGRAPGKRQDDSFKDLNVGRARVLGGVGVQDHRVSGRTAHQDGGTDDGCNAKADVGRLAQGVETNIPVRRWRGR